jgi:hypothetical protein
MMELYSVVVPLNFRPLDEGKKLKERFDLIFESTKYNKCIEALSRKKKAMKISELLIFYKTSLIKYLRKSVLDIA